MDWIKVEFENWGFGIKMFCLSYSLVVYKLMWFELFVVVLIFLYVKLDLDKFGIYFIDLVSKIIIERFSVVVFYILVICGYN